MNTHPERTEMPTYPCTHCGTVKPIDEMDLGEDFAACSDDCLMAIQDAADAAEVR